MKKTFIILIGLTMVLTTVPAGIAEHNTIGYGTTAGGPDPVPSDEPDVRDGGLPVYHAGATPPTGSPTAAFEGTYPRISPPDQSGLGMGEWIGFIDGVVEYPGQLAITPTHPNDPLYRVSPADDGNGCDDVTDNQDLGDDETDPSDDPCAGTDHRTEVRVHYGHLYQQHNMDHVSPVLSDDPLSGFLFPGLYNMYVYLFGDGTSEHRAGEGVFDYLPASLCDDHLAKLGITNNLPVEGDHGKCTLITADDLENPLGLDETDALGTKQKPKVCSFAPWFFETGSDPNPPVCQFEIPDFVDSEGTFYISNKPGWYDPIPYIDQFGSFVNHPEGMTADGIRSDLTYGHFSFYVNPVRPAGALRCAAPPISTFADDALDSGVSFDEANGEWTTSEAPEFEYIVEAYDIDLYTAIDSTPAQELVQQVQDLIPDLPEPIEQLIEAVEDEADTVLDPASEASGRLFPYTLNRAEPNSDEDNSFTLERASDVPLGVCLDGLNDPAEVDGESPNFLNYIQATYTTGQTFNGLVLHDYTELDESGLPRDADEQGYNPWNPNTYSFNGDVMGFLDRNPDGEFNGCPTSGNQPTPSQDICEALIVWDVNNENSEIQSVETPTWAAQNGWDSFTGLYFTLKVTGPVATYDAENAPNENQAVFEDRTRVLESPGQNCIVGTSKGLLDANGARFMEIIGAEGQAASEANILATLCGGADGDTALISDAFFDQNDEGDFSAAFEWVKLAPTPEATNPDTGDGLTLNAVLTVVADGDTLTGPNLDLASFEEPTPTLESVWDDDGDKTFVWTDHDAFDSDPYEPSEE